MFSLTDVPFSYFESWMSISIPRKETDLFLRNCHNGPHNICPIQMLVKDEVVEPEVTALPWSLILSHGDTRVEICFENADTIRLRGRGATLILGKRNLIYSEAPNRAVINERAAFRRYQMEALRGTIELKQVVPTQRVFPKTAHVHPGPDGCWELAIDEFWSTWTPRDRGTFDDCLAAAERTFKAFLATMPEARDQDQPARELAAYVNWSSTVGPCGLLERPTLFMSKNWMCNVWSWDQCFNAMALAGGQPDLALDQMLVLVDHQDEFGSYPDSVNDQVKHYNFSKPPVHGWAFREILKRLPKPPSSEVMRTMYVSLRRQADWWMTHRRGEGGRLPYYLHGNDSGWDNSTMFDQGVPLTAPDLAALLITQMDVLSGLAGQVGESEVTAQSWKTRANELQVALMDELWRGDHFVAISGCTGQEVESHSLIPWLPIILGERLPKDIRNSLKNGVASHLTEWGLATEHVDSPKYNPDGYWTGPIWGPSTYLAVTGLDRCGFTELADEISNRFCKLCGMSGFAENYDALTGKGLCDLAYTWTASVFLLLAERMTGRDT
ncbi:MAG: trehalase family glycosidase [Lentisphaeria bacterium]|nr:trehalase family glycosidase [Lentisphaeria bacterium]